MVFVLGIITVSSEERGGIIDWLVKNILENFQRFLAIGKQVVGARTFGCGACPQSVHGLLVGGVKHLV